MFKRLIATLICVTFSFNNLQYVHAQGFSVNQLPVPGTMIGESAPFAPLALKGLVVNPSKPLEFQFIVDTGKGPQDTASVKGQANQLVKYFLAGLTIPEGDLWVNLSPYEKNRMVPEALGQTDLGRDLLAQDYILKQLTASLIYPEKDLGKEFWSRVYAKAQTQFGTTNVPVNTFNKVWILPDLAQVFENGAAAYVTKSTLKVMLDEDYLALQKHVPSPSVGRVREGGIASQIISQIILPEITKEVNIGKNFAPLLQIYQALILAKWYKKTIQNGLLDALYTNKNKVVGVNLDDPAVKEQIYNRYLQAYKKGAFNYIKEDPTPEGQIVPRKYFSGGITHLGDFAMSTDGKALDVASDGEDFAMKVDLEKPTDAAMMHISNMFNVLKYQDPIADEEIDDLLILGNENFDLFREALRYFARGKGKRIVILGGYGHGTPPLIEAVKKSGFKFSTGGMSESRIIRNVMQKMVEQEVEFSGLRQKMNPGTYDKIFLLEERSTNTPENLKNYKGLLSFSGGKAYNVLFFQAPEMQLRSKATFGGIFEQEIRVGRIKDIGLTIDYDIRSKPIDQVIETVIREAWRIIIYSDYGKKNISFFETRYRSVDGIPGNFWDSANSLFTGINDDEKRQFAKSLVALAAPEFSTQSVSGSANSQMKGFVENVLNAANAAMGGGKKDEAMTISIKIATLRGGAELLSRLDLGNVDGSRSFIVGLSRDGVLSASSRGMPYKINSTPLEVLERRLNLVKNIESLDKARKNKSEDIVVLDWGCGTGQGLVELQREIKKRKIKNVVLVGFDGQYYPEWNNAPSGISFILDVPVLQMYLRGLHGVDLVYSHSALTLLFTKVIEHSFKDLYPLLAAKRGKILIWPINRFLPINRFNALYRKKSIDNNMFEPPKVEGTGDDQSVILIAKPGPEDRAQLGKAPGGIDLNQIKVNRTGKTINVQFDQALLSELEQGGFEGFTPVIESMTHISSPFQLLGVNIAEQTKVLAKV